MIKYFCSVLAGAILTFYTAKGQSFIPFNIEQAIKNRSRTDSGLPGENYFQNHADYKMEVSFDPREGKLSGKADIVYYNNSPDTLKRIVIRLYQNIRKKGGIRDESYHFGDVHDGVSITTLLLNGSDLLSGPAFRMKETGTNLILVPDDHILPGGSADIKIHWNFVMPASHVHRYGKYGEGNYFVAYWYPQVSVYDDIDGWDLMNYTGTHEFYNDFNNYDVTIRVPGNHMVWATGLWQNPEKIFDEIVLSKLNKSHQTDEVIKIISSDDWDNKNVFSKSGAHTFHFNMEMIPDFAFAVSGDYLWDATSVLIDSLSGKRVWISSVYQKDCRHFQEVASISRLIIQDLACSSYGSPFPFPGITIFNGKGGTEFPMIINNEDKYTRDGAVFITMHEIAHSYFPFLTGINERKYSWMDEGLTTYLPLETEKALGSEYYPLNLILERYLSDSGTENDIPLFVPAYQTREYPYQFYSYFRSTVAFYMLEEYFTGKKAFRSSIREFIQVWQYRHPTPYDLFAMIKRHTGEDIDWLIDAWFFGPGWPDLALGEVTFDSDIMEVEVLNKGSLPVPVHLTIEYHDGSTETIRQGPDVWKNGDKCLIEHVTKDRIKKLNLDYRNLPDKDSTNNTYLIHQH
ncbi:MAG: M1 family metallopeptidase [Bacteroidales bacterium]|jgi:hypothetical protein